MLRFVADLGNTRIKWAMSGPSGLDHHAAFAKEDEAAWSAAIRALMPPGSASDWAIASVNPPLADRLGAVLGSIAGVRVRWVRSAAEVPIRSEVEGAETGGADRALAVLAANRLRPEGRPARVVLCGTAITVERVSAEGVWQGGSIAPGLGMSARALHEFTAGLPRIATGGTPPDWGRGTVDSLRAGLIWGTAGSIRELLARQAIGEDQVPWVVWSGGDAPSLALLVEGPQSRIVPDLVLRGVAKAAFRG